MKEWMLYKAYEMEIEQASWEVLSRTMDAESDKTVVLWIFSHSQMILSAFFHPSFLNSNFTNLNHHSDELAQFETELKDCPLWGQAGKNLF